MFILIRISSWRLLNRAGWQLIWESNPPLSKACIIFTVEAAQCAHHYYNTFVEAMHWRHFLLTYESNWNWERSNFQGIQINFAPPRPAGFANFRGEGQDLLFCGAGRGSPFFAGRGGAPIPAGKTPRRRKGNMCSISWREDYPQHCLLNICYPPTQDHTTHQHAWKVFLVA